MYKTVLIVMFYLIGCVNDFGIPELDKIKQIF